MTMTEASKAAWCTIGEPEGTRLLVSCPAKTVKTEGGIYIPDVAWTGKDQRGETTMQIDVRERERRARATKGRILRAGLKALDMMEGRGWKMMDEVTWGQYSPLFLAYKDPEGNEHEALVIDFNDVLTNISLAQRLAAEQQTIRREVVDGAPQHLIVDAERMAA